jgi:hypothetical protein
VQHIDYAKSKSYATSKREDPNFVPPTSANASAFINGKRPREDDGGEPQAKRDRADDSDEEMEIDDDEEEQGPVVDFDTCMSDLYLLFSLLFHEYFVLLLQCAKSRRCPSNPVKSISTTVVYQFTTRGYQPGPRHSLPTVRPITLS